MSERTAEQFLRELFEDFREPLESVREDLTVADLTANRASWLTPFAEAGLPVHKGSKVIMLATLYQLLDLAGKLEKEELEEYGWTLFLSILDDLE